MRQFLKNSVLKAEQALNRYGIRVLEAGTWGGLMSSYVCVSLMFATLFSGLLNPASLPALCLGSLGAAAGLGLAKCGAEKWTWTRAIAREREADAPARSGTHYVEAPKLARGRPLGPKFHAVALTPAEAAPYFIRKATVLADDLKVGKPFMLKV